MLSPPDAELAAREPCMPGLAAVLDPERVAALVGGSGGGGAEITYVRYKPGTSCIVGYQTAGDLETRHFYVKAHATAMSAKFEGARLRGAQVIEPLIVVIPFVADRGLTGLAMLGRAHRTALWQRLAPGREDLCGAWLRTLRYKPERRYVAAAVVDEAPRAVLKFYPAATFDDARRRAAAFESRDDLRIPRLMRTARRHHVLATEWQPGEALELSQLDEGAAWKTACRVGHALRQLHAQHNADLRPQALSRLVRQFKAVARDLGVLLPPRAEHARRLAKRLAQKLENRPNAVSPVHGDFHAGQIVVNADRLTVLDFDRAVRGDPAADLGTFLAHVEYQQVRTLIARARVDEIRDGLLAGYGVAARSMPTRIVELYAAAGLLRLAPHAFRDRERDWPGTMTLILERAEQMLQRRNHVWA